MQGREDIPLNETGRSQARLCARVLARLGPATVVSSPLGRAAETAQAIADLAHAGPVWRDEAFIERDAGRISGQCYLGMDLTGDWGMEPLDELADRMQRGLLGWQDAPGPVAVVTHGMALAALLGRLAGDDKKYSGAQLKNCCINMIQLENGHFTLLDMNRAPEELLHSAAG